MILCACASWVLHTRLPPAPPRRGCSNRLWGIAWSCAALRKRISHACAIMRRNAHTYIDTRTYFLSSLSISAPSGRFWCYVTAADPHCASDETCGVSIALNYWEHKYWIKWTRSLSEKQKDKRSDLGNLLLGILKRTDEYTSIQPGMLYIFTNCLCWTAVNVLYRAASLPTLVVRAARIHAFHTPRFDDTALMR